MKKIMKALVKGVSLLLAVITSMAVVGCTPTNTTPTEAKEPDLIYFGQHDYTAPDIEDKWLVKDGKTEYKLVVPADTREASTTYFGEARTEFVKFFEASTNIAIEVVVDDTLPVKEHSADQYYISLDDTLLFDSLKDTEKEIDCSVGTVTRLGGKIVTVDNNIYINGFSDMGTLNMVYTFLSITFNWETYSANTTVYDENVTNKNLKAYDVFDIPDTHYTPTSGYERSTMVNVFSTDWGYRHDHPTEGGYYYGQRVRAYSEDSGPVKKITEIFLEKEIEEITDVEYYALSNPGGHNSTEVVNFDTWGGDHPAWFGTTGAIQLCYTCNGNAEELDLVTTLVAKMICRGLMYYPREKYPHKNVFPLTMTDNSTMCSCDTCMREKAKYKDSGLVVKYMNIIAQKVEDWMNLPENEPYKRDEFRLEFYAYLTCENPPAKLNNQGEWEPIDETVRMHKNTTVIFAPIKTDFQQSLFAEDNKFALDMFDGWAAVSGGNISYFMYNYLCKSGAYFYDAFDHYDTRGMNHYLAGGRTYYYAENIHGNVPTEWGALISYVNAKLCYDSTLDSGELINNWFEACFGPSAGIMKEMWWLMRIYNHEQLLASNGYRRDSIMNQVYHTFFWSQAAIQGWIAKADEAIANIEYLKETDPEEYDRIVYNIELEVVSPIWVLFNQDGNTKSSNVNLSEAEWAQYKTRIYNNINKYAEYKYASSATICKWIETF